MRHPHEYGVSNCSHGMNRMEREAAKVRGEYDPEVLQELRRQHREGESPLGMMARDQHARITRDISDEVRFANKTATLMADISRGKYADPNPPGRLAGSLARSKNRIRELQKNRSAV